MINRLLPILITSVLLAGCTKTETTKGGIAQEMELAKTCWRCDNVFLSSGYCPVMIFWERIGNTHCSMIYLGDVVRRCRKYCDIYLSGGISDYYI